MQDSSLVAINSSEKKRKWPGHDITMELLAFIIGNIKRVHMAHRVFFCIVFLKHQVSAYVHVQTKKKPQTPKTSYLQTMIVWMICHGTNGVIWPLCYRKKKKPHTHTWISLARMPFVICDMLWMKKRFPINLQPVQGMSDWDEIRDIKPLVCFLDHKITNSKQQRVKLSKWSSWRTPADTDSHGS